MEFQYKVKAQNGNVLRGNHAADSEKELISWIREQGWIPIEVKAATGKAASAKSGSSSSASDFFDLSPKVKSKDKLIFFRQLATMIMAGVPIVSALEILVQQTGNRRFKKILRRVFERVSSGVPLATALAENPKCFDTLAISLIRSGEESGTLDSSLGRLSWFIESQENLRKKIISAFTYPGAVMSIALLVLGILCVVVVPQFQKAFSGLGVKMPALTLAIFDIGQWAQHNWKKIPIAIIIIVVAIRFLSKFPAMRYPIDVVKLKLPIFGGIIYKACISRSFRTMGALLQAGVPVLQTIELAGEVAGNEKIRRNFFAIRDAAAMGSTMNSVMKERKLFPPMVCHMVAVGEETGRTDDMLSKIADWYEGELEETIKRLSSVLEPVLVVFVGGIVAIMVIAIFLPIIASIQAFM